MKKGRSESRASKEITSALREMIWRALCEDGAQESQIVGFSIIHHPLWRNHISQLSKLAGEPDEDFSSVQGVISWENWQRVFRNEPELIEQVRQALAAPSRRLTVCCVSLCGNTFEITYLDPLRPDTLN